MKRIKQANWDSREQELEDSITAIQQNSRPSNPDKRLERALDIVLHASKELKHQIALNAIFQETAIPESVISFRVNGFDINVDGMDVEKKYRFRFEGSLYEVWKNISDELEFKEIR